MTKYVALHTLSITVQPGVAKTATSAAKRPITKEIAPGTIIVIDDKAQADAWLEAKAIRPAVKDDTKAAHVETMTSLTDEQIQAAALEEARLNREKEAETKRREAEAAKAKTPATPKAAATPKPAAATPKAAAKPADAGDGGLV